MSFIEHARQWLSGDIDDGDIQAVKELIANGDEKALERLFSRTAQFGTAGLRETLGPGPGQLNRAVVRRTTYAVGRYLLETQGPKGKNERHVVVLGWDARPSSSGFARETAAVLIALGIEVRYFLEAVPTPMVAYALLAYDASAAVVITASHNGPDYNGYKLYGENGAQIVSPADVEIAQRIESGPAAKDIAVVEDALSAGHALARPVETQVIDSYFAAIAKLRPTQSSCRDLPIAYTPLHGVGYAPVRRAFNEAGFTGLSVVKSQSKPDGTFATLKDHEPNPERFATLELAREHGDHIGADLILANDPDADRLAVNIRDRSGKWRALSGNQIGVLLADYQLSRYEGDDRPLVPYSIVSTPMIRSIADTYGARAEPTLTGFKWLWTATLALRAKRSFHFVFGFEEALGYCVEDIVRDKDGVSAALLFAEMTAEDAAVGKTIESRLAHLYRTHGLWVSRQATVTQKDGDIRVVKSAVEQLAKSPPNEVQGRKVESFLDYSDPGKRPAWLGKTTMLEFNLEGGARLLVRPSGTEPKLKIYSDLCRPFEMGHDLWQQLEDGDKEADAVAVALRDQMKL